MGNIFSEIEGNRVRLDKLAIEEEGGLLTYGDLLGRTAQFAHWLQGRGVGRGDVVAIQEDKSADYIILYLAVVRMGAVFLPINKDYTAAELRHFIDDAAPKLFFGTPPVLAQLAASHPQLRTASLNEDGGSIALSSRDESRSFPTAACADSDLAAILYTSGTTGRSKGAMLTHGNLASNARTLVEYWSFSEEDVLLHVLPVFHTHGLFVACNTALLAGASMIFERRFIVDRVLQALPRSTVMMAVPTLYSRLIDDGRIDRDICRGMRLFTSGSAPLLAETHRDFQARTGHAILERYGMTETNMITSNPYDGERVPGTVGLPLPGISVRIADDAGVPVGGGSVGILEVKGPNVFAGYRNMEEKTAEEFRPDGYFITGDIATVDDKGYITLIGRAKDLIISGGLNVYPKEVELAIDAMDGVEESAVIGCPHPDMGEGVTAIVVPGEGSALTEHAVKSALGNVLAPFKLPKRVLFVSELPRNTMGKVQKNLLREQNRDIYSGTVSAP